MAVTSGPTSGRTSLRARAGLLSVLVLSACAQAAHLGSAPDFKSVDGSFQHHALYNTPLPEVTEVRRATDEASLWSASQRSLLGDRRASRQGDILTVVIEIDESAEMSNTTGRSREGNTTAGLPQLLGLPQVLNRRLPAGATLANAVQAQGGTTFNGTGNVARNEQLTLRVAATVVERLPNGVMRLEGSQEVRVNNELRELLVTGYVRAEDISRRNEITYDKIAGARISYGGRGHISDMQQPRLGQQFIDMISPF